MTNDQAALEREASYFHSLFFQGQVPDVVIGRYVAANHLCFPILEAGDRKMMETILARGLDAEAIELAMRLRRGSGVLTRKIQILFFLVEVRSAYYGYFVNQTPGLPRALSRLFGSCLRTVWKGVKGCYLVWRYGLA
jgi:hypothetical protein